MRKILTRVGKNSDGHCNFAISGSEPKQSPVVLAILRISLWDKLLPDSIPIFDSFSVSADSTTDHLLFAMAAQVKHNIVLTEGELLALKSWLVKRAEDFESNQHRSWNF